MKIELDKKGIKLTREEIEKQVKSERICNNCLNGMKEGSLCGLCLQRNYGEDEKLMGCESCEKAIHWDCDHFY